MNEGISWHLRALIRFRPRAAQFSVLFDPIVGAALKNAVFLTRDVEDAEDLVQESAIQAFRAFEQFEEGTNFKAWFLKIQYN